jgi:hypothetical protein
MTDFKPTKGFQDAFAPPAPRRGKRERPVLSGGGPKGGSGARSASPAAKARLARVVTKAPEVMVKVTSRTKDAGHLRAHLEYISRNGEVPLETRDGSLLLGRGSIHDYGDGWAAEVEADARHRASSPYSVNVMLSMPPGTDPAKVTDAVRAFARETFEDRFEYAFAYHGDTKHPHVHLTVRPVGDDRQRLNPRKADLEQWRQTFAQKLRDRGVAAEATPRRARGVTLKPQKTPIRKMVEKGAAPNVLRQARIEAGRAAFGRDNDLRPWEAASVARQKEIRSIYLREAKDLAASKSPEDQALAKRLEQFVRSMPQPDSQRLSMARELREAYARQQAARATEGRGRDEGPQTETPGPTKDRGRGR